MWLPERLDGSPVTCRTLCGPGYPSFFTLFGPYSSIGNNSIIENSERQIRYVMKCLELIASGCDSWYLDANGEPIVYPFGRGRFIQEMRERQLDDFVLD